LPRCAATASACRRDADGGAQDSELVEAVRLGVDGIILKEAAHSQLLPCLEALREGGRWMDDAMLERVRGPRCRAGQAGDPASGLKRGKGHCQADRPRDAQPRHRGASST
jgi:hypothetical protein